MKAGLWRYGKSFRRFPEEASLGFWKQPKYFCEETRRVFEGSWGSPKKNPRVPRKFSKVFSQTRIDDLRPNCEIESTSAQLNVSRRFGITTEAFTGFTEELSEDSGK